MVELFRIHIENRLDAHVALRKILSSYLGQDPEKICFERNSNGKLEHPKIFFNLSHSQKLAIIAVSQLGPVGVDIEYFREIKNLLSIAKRFFSSSELVYLENLSAESQTKAFFELWTAKEALVKARGLRLMDYIRQEVSWAQVRPISDIEGYVGHVSCCYSCF